jgi:putative ABC transport system permease protein
MKPLQLETLMGSSPMLRKLNAGINNRLLALKLSRRSMKYNAGQSLLIVFIIALPVIFATIGLTYFESQIPTAQEKVTYQLGQTQARFTPNVAVSDSELEKSSKSNIIQVPDEGNAFRFYSDDAPPIYDPGTYQDPRKTGLVSGSWLTERNDLVEVQTKTGVGIFSLVEGELWSESLKGRISIIDGSAPATKNEVLVSKAGLERLGLGIGDSLKLTSLNESRKIVGVATDALRGRDISAIFAGTASITGVLPESDLANTSFYLVSDEPVTWETVVKLNRLGIGVLSKEVVLNPPTDGEIPAYAAGYQKSQDTGLLSALGGVAAFMTLAFVPIAVLAGSAFSFGARRQARTLAVLSSLGAKRKYLRFITIANGIWLGFLGGLLGVLAGLLAAYFVLPLFSDGSKSTYPGFHIPWLSLSGIVLAAAIIGAVVSVIPAITAAKVDVLSTLRGVRSGATVKKRLGIAGMVVTLIGAATTVAGGVLLSNYGLEVQLAGNYNPFIMQLLQLMPVLGSIILIIGLLMMSGWLLVLTRFALKRAGVLANYATNDLIFNRKRYQSVISAVLATSYVASALLGVLYSFDKTGEENYVNRLPENQLVNNPIWSLSDWSSGDTDSIKPKESYELRLKEGLLRLESNLKIATSVAPINSAALVSVHAPLSQLGYKVDMLTGIPEYGAEGDQPLIRVNKEFLCPWDPTSPRNKEFVALESSNKVEDQKAKLEITRDPKYRYCDSVDFQRQTLYVGTAEDLTALLGKPASKEAIAALNSGGAVALSPSLYVSNSVYLDWYPSGSQEILNAKKGDVTGDPLINNLPTPELKKTVALDAVLEESINRDLTIMISKATANSLGIDYKAGIMVVNYQDALTVAQTDQLNANLNGGYVMETGYPGNPELVAWIVFAIGGFFVLAATAVALGLSQIEARADLSTLGSIGAPRRFRARVLGLQALLLTGLGTLLGSATGYYLAWSMMASGGENIFRVALPQIVMLVVGVPLFTALIFWIGTPSKSEYKVRLAVD